MSFIDSITSNYSAFWNIKLHNSASWSRVLACVTFELELAFYYVSPVFSFLFLFPLLPRKYKNTLPEHKQQYVVLLKDIKNSIIFHAQIIWKLDFFFFLL